MSLTKLPDDVIKEIVEYALDSVNKSTLPLFIISASITRILNEILRDQAKTLKMNPFFIKFYADLIETDDLFLTKCFKFSYNTQSNVQEFDLMQFLSFMKSTLFSRNKNLSKLFPFGLEALNLVIQKQEYFADVEFHRVFAPIIIRLVCDCGLQNIASLAIAARFYNYPLRILPFLTVNVPEYLRLNNIPADPAERESLILGLERADLMLKIQMVMVSFLHSSLLSLGYFHVHGFNSKSVIIAYTTFWPLISYISITLVKDYRLSGP